MELHNRAAESAAKDISCLTDILVRWNDGDTNAEQLLYQFAYQKFRQIAAEVKSKTLDDQDYNSFLAISSNTTSLVHDAFIKLNQSKDFSPRNSHHLYIYFANVIYSILVDHVRKSQAKKRQEQLVGGLIECDVEKLHRIIEIESILKKLSIAYSRQVAVFIYKYVCLMPVKEIATLLSISESTIDKDLSFIKLQVASYCQS
ncbi:ECF-type sigma factor [Shewanella halifaxensis]|uniref:ECF-type sigma factor n=1 Tax=Shewanella halifaxensis TaxID=271098 RepID=UPI0013A62FFA|nr:ECF-type sigma factor [Shewanella halifaxensis]